MASRQFEVITRCTIFSQIANFCRKVLGKEDGEQSAESPIPARVAGQRRTLSRDQHPISRKEISENALKVLYRLNKGGYEAYLVGGGVRDLLLGKTPKDFDIATDATPEQIKSLFSNCRLIGRRFRLAHIVFGRDVIEVATFRGHHHQVNTSKHVSAQSDEGMLLRDNVYGTIEEDAERRDFTVNALYYSAKDFTLHDFEGGLEDLAERKLELIGDPETRYREDPVRMLRAVRFAAKLDMTISPRTAAPSRSWRRCCRIFRRPACSRRPSSCSWLAMAWPPTSCCANTACSNSCSRRWRRCLLRTATRPTSSLSSRR